jgi:hypothetical protein
MSKSGGAAQYWKDALTERDHIHSSRPLYATYCGGRFVKASAWPRPATLRPATNISVQTQEAGRGVVRARRRVGPG